MSVNTAIGPLRWIWTVGPTPRKPASTVLDGSQVSATPVITVFTCGSVTSRPSRRTVRANGPSRLPRINVD